VKSSIAAFGADALSDVSDYLKDSHVFHVPYAGADAFSKQELKYIWEASLFNGARYKSNNCDDIV